MRRVVSRGELRAILQAHIEDPSPRGLRYYELPTEVVLDEYLTFDEEHRAWFEPVVESVASPPPRFGDEVEPRKVGVYQRYVLAPGSYDAWIVDT